MKCESLDSAKQWGRPADDVRHALFLSKIECSTLFVNRVAKAELMDRCRRVNYALLCVLSIYQH